MNTLEKLKALSDAATPGPWGDGNHFSILNLDTGHTTSSATNTSDQLLIVAMRNCIDELVQVVEAAQTVPWKHYRHEPLDKALAALASKMGENK